MKSILQTEKKCFVCGKTYDLAVHHVYEGTANRRVSDATGMTIFLCHYHHNMSDEGIHFNKELIYRSRDMHKRFMSGHIHEKSFDPCLGRVGYRRV